MPMTKHRARTTTAALSAAEGGIALVLALIFSILLYILVAELVVAGRMVRATGENDALLARMRTQMLYQMRDAEDQLLGDLAGAAGQQGGGAGGVGGALGGAAGKGGSAGSGGSPSGGSSAAGNGGTGAGAAASGGAAGAGGAGAEEPDPASQCDGSRDAWFEPVGHPDNDLTTYVWVEDENRKFNLLSIWSPDEKFADFSRDRLVRLIDCLREDTEFDVPQSDAQRIVADLIEWGRRGGTEAMPRPKLKSDNDKRREISVMLHLDELLLLRSIKEDLYFDKILDGRWYPGLESVLTIWTALKVDTGNPEKIARQKAAAEARGETPPATGTGAASGTAGSGASGSQASGQAPGSQGAGSGQNPANAQGANGTEQPVQPDGEGIRVNLNTASRPVLRSLFPVEKIPDRVIDAIIKYRNKEDEKAREKANSQQAKTAVSDFGNMRLGSQVKKQVFTTVADLEQVDEFAKLADPEMKADFQKAVTTKSEVFTIHLASLHKRSEENRVYLLRRARTIVLRVDDGANGKIVPLVPFEERVGLRVQPVDIQDQNTDLTFLYSQMDQFAQEDRAWNPFYVDFYLPKHIRQQFYQPR